MLYTTGVYGIILPLNYCTIFSWNAHISYHVYTVTNFAHFYSFYRLLKIHHLHLSCIVHRNKYNDTNMHVAHYCVLQVSIFPFTVRTRMSVVITVLLFLTVVGIPVAIALIIYKCKTKKGSIICYFQTLNAL